VDMMALFMACSVVTILNRLLNEIIIHPSIFAMN